MEFLERRILCLNQNVPAMLLPIDNPLRDAPYYLGGFKKTLAFGQPYAPA